jgi:hypothetical protein
MKTYNDIQQFLSPNVSEHSFFEGAEKFEKERLRAALKEGIAKQTDRSGRKF